MAFFIIRESGVVAIMRSGEPLTLIFSRWIDLGILGLFFNRSISMCLGWKTGEWGTGEGEGRKGRRGLGLFLLDIFNDRRSDTSVISDCFIALMFVCLLCFCYFSVDLTMFFSFFLYSS